MILGKFSVGPDNMGILRLLFPGAPLLREPLPPFISNELVMVQSERAVDFYPGKKVVQVTRAAQTKLDSREGFCDFLRSRGVRIGVDQEEAMKHMEDGEFWERGKVMAVLGSAAGFLGTKEESSVFMVFVSLFERFDLSYGHYRRCGSPHRVVFSALLTMMLKTQQSEVISVSAGYKKALLKNKVYYSAYRKAVMDYVESGMEDMNFIEFLFDCSEAKR